MEQYNKIQTIGKGTFGTVNLVERIADKKLLAIKKTHLLQDNSYTPENEIKILESLNHPNIIKYYESFTVKNKFYIVTDYAKQGDLQQYINRHIKDKSFIDEKIILDFLIQITNGMCYLQDKKILHRDLKAQNIFLTKKFEKTFIKIGDFGISKQLNGTNDLAKTSLGTPYYLSPEICQNQYYSHKSDVWMLGCVLYEMTSLEKPFQGDSLNAIIYNIMNNKPKPLPSIYSQTLNEIIFGLLEKNQENRFNIYKVQKILLQNYKIVPNKLLFENEMHILKTPTTKESDQKFKKKVQISIVTQNLNNQKKGLESDKQGIQKVIQDECSENRPKSFQFGVSIFDSKNPTSPQRQMLFQDFLQKRLGKQKFNQTLEYLKQQIDPFESIKEEDESLINLLGIENKDTLKCFKMLFLQPQNLDNKKFNFLDLKQ